MLKRFWIFYVTGLLMACDLVSKYYCFQYVPFLQKTSVVGILYWLPVYNTGMAWSLGANLGHLVPILSLLLSFYCLSELCRSYSVTWSLICAGAFANTYDRIAYGAVRDFIALSYRGWTFPVFNLADCFLCLGIGCLLLQPYFSKLFSLTLLGER